MPDQPTAAEPPIYRSFLAEREEILRHKWLMSEREGADVGFERALTDWTLRHRPEWKKSYLKGLKSESAA